MNDLPLTDRPRPGWELVALFAVAFVLFLVSGVPAWVAEHGSLATAAWVGLPVVMMLELWRVFARCSYTLTEDHLLVYYGPGSPEKFELGDIISLERRSWPPLRFWCRRAANRVHNGIEIRVKGTFGSYWIAPTDPDRFFALLVAAKNHLGERPTDR